MKTVLNVQSPAAAGMTVRRKLAPAPSGDENSGGVIAAEGQLEVGLGWRQAAIPDQHHGLLLLSLSRRRRIENYAEECNRVK